MSEQGVSEQSVVARRDGRVGRILLNRPKALNALDLPMIQACAAALAKWRDDPSIHAVVIEGAGERAFCAGGDIRAIRGHAMAGETDIVESFFREEYALNQAIASYPKPYIALVDGICMGGGIGVSVHGPYRVASEHAMFAMPETAIGFFPDIGASYFLPRLPGELGMYLGLTGTRVLGSDAVHAGFATHYVPRTKIAELSRLLALDGPAALGAFAEPISAFAMQADRAAIDRCFAADSVPDIIQRLERDGGEWAQRTLKTLQGMSPHALFWSFEIIRRGARATLADALQAELELTRAVTVQPDFHEGVRAMVVDKDRQPKWAASRIEQVDPAEINRLFS